MKSLFSYIFLCFVCGILVTSVARHINESDNKQEILYPEIEYGARIYGTNFVVKDGDTLEIKKHVKTFYTYEILDSEQRKQAREVIKKARE